MLSRRMQLQAISDMRAGLKTEYPLFEFDDELRGIAYALQTTSPDQCDTKIERILAGLKNGNAIMQSILQMQPGGNGRCKSQPFSEVAPGLKPVRFLWPGWIPQGMITLFGAVPGAGKSYIALDFCRRIIHGEPWPDGMTHQNTGRNVIYVDAENIPQITKERAEAWQMDMSRFYVLIPHGDEMVDLTRQEDRDQLIELAYETRPALVVIDSLSTISSKGENAVEDVRQVLSFLNALARDFETGLVLVHHLRKRNPLAMLDLVTIDDFRGSSHIMAMARSVMALSIIQTTRERNPNGPRRLEVIKSNVCAHPDPLGVTFQPLHPRGIRLEYGETPERYREPSEVERCMDWLITMLRSEPMSIGELTAEGMFSRSTIIRARERLAEKIESTSGRQSPDNKWKLTEEQTTEF